MSLRIKEIDNKKFKSTRAFDKNNIMYIEWVKFPEMLTIKPGMEGRRVWVSGDTKQSKCFLTKIHEVGSKFFPNGGYTVWSSVEGRDIHLLLTEAILYPSKEGLKSPDELKELERKKKENQLKRAKRLKKKKSKRKIKKR